MEFIVGATTDAGDLTYQWKLERGGVKIDPLPEGVSGATTNTLTIPNVRERHTGEYSCVVSNAAGDTTSQPTRLTLRKYLYQMKGTEMPNPRRSSVCDCTCVLTRIDNCPENNKLS